jgi:hypothetical protein
MGALGTTRKKRSGDAATINIASVQPSGDAESNSSAHGFKVDMLVKLIRAGLATAGAARC